MATLALLGCPKDPPDADDDTTAAMTAGTTQPEQSSSGGTTGTTGTTGGTTAEPGSSSSTTADTGSSDGSSSSGSTTGDTTTGGSSGLFVMSESLMIPGVRGPVTTRLDADETDDVVIAMPKAYGAIVGAAPTDPFYHPAGQAIQHIVAAADLDDDSDSDLVSIQLVIPDTVLASVRRTDTGFEDLSTLDLAPCANPLSLAIGDLDGDATADVVIGCMLPGVMISRGLGGGLLADPMLLPLDSSPTGVVLADVLGSPALDLVAFEQNTQELLVYAGTGDLAFEFAASQAFSTTDIPHYMATGDLDGDGVDDYLLGVGLKGACIPYFATGDGLMAGTLTSCGSYPVDADIGDFDGDGLGDVAVMEYVDSLPGALHVMRGHGDGTFDAPAIHETGFNSLYLALGDYNGDTHLDIVVISQDLVTFFYQTP